MSLANISGTYGLALATGTMAAGIAAESEIFQFRWTSATVNARVESLMVSAGNLGTAFAAGFGSFGLFLATGFSAAGTGGGTATLTTINGKHAEDDGVTALTEARIATTAALGAGTKTLAAHPISAAWFGVPNVAGSPMLDPWEFLKYPVILKAGSSAGLIVKVTVPITGTWTGGVAIKWKEFA